MAGRVRGVWWARLVRRGWRKRAEEAGKGKEFSCCCNEHEARRRSWQRSLGGGSSPSQGGEWVGRSAQAWTWPSLANARFRDFVSGHDLSRSETGAKASGL